MDPREDGPTGEDLPRVLDAKTETYKVISSGWGPILDSLKTLLGARAALEFCKNK